MKSRTAHSAPSCTALSPRIPPAPWISQQLFGSVRAALHAVDCDRPLESPESMTAKIRKQASGLRYVAALMGTFGFFALALAAVGVYRVLGQRAPSRNRIRMALGARRSDVLRNLMGRGLHLSRDRSRRRPAPGLAMAQLLSRFLYGVATWDATVFNYRPVGDHRKRAATNRAPGNEGGPGGRAAV